jgi:hypothetical protein
MMLLANDETRSYFQAQINDIAGQLNTAIEERKQHSAELAAIQNVTAQAQPVYPRHLYKQPFSLKLFLTSS